jgi:hypothetical protein
VLGITWEEIHREYQTASGHKGLALYNDRRIDGGYIFELERSEMGIGETMQGP